MSLTAATFLLLYMSGLIASIVRHPIFGLYTYMLAFFVAPNSHWWGNDLPNVRWLFIAAAVALVSTLIRKSETVYPPWFSNGGGRLVLLFVLWMWLQTTWAIVPLDTQLEGAELFTKHLITFILVYRIVNTPERLRAFSLAFVAGIAYFGYEALGESGRLENVGGSVSNANALGFYASAGMLFASFLFLGVKGKTRWLALACVPLIMNCVILIQSRGTMIGLMAGGFVAFKAIPRSLRKGFILSGVLALFLFSMLVHDAFWTRMSSLSDVFDDADTVSDASAGRRDALGRMAVFKMGWEIGLDYPLGAGYRASRILSPHYLPVHFLDADTGNRGAHNTMMAALSEHGFVGLGLYILAVYWVFTSNRKLRALELAGRPREFGVYRTIIVSALAVAFVSGQFSNFLQAELPFWLLAMLGSLCNISRNATSTSDAAIPVAVGFGKTSTRP